MKILVGVKRVLDYAVKVRVRSDKTGVDLTNMKMSMNPFDEIAVEEALKLKEKGIATEVVAVSVGPAASAEVIRSALALGADRGIHVAIDKADASTLTVAKLLKGVVAKEKPDLILMGKQAIDDDSNQTGQMVAGLLNYPQGTFASKVEVSADKKSVAVTREIDGGLETILLNTPAVITCDLRLNTPRYAKLANIMKAKKATITKMTAEELGVTEHTGLKTVSVEEPAKRKGGVVVDSVETLLSKLKNEAKVI